MVARESNFTPDSTALDMRDIEFKKIGTDDLVKALRAGLDDFRQMPTHLIMLALIYPIAGLIAGRWVWAADMLPLLFPLVSGFALVGPIAAVGLYELSRRREQGYTPTWSDVKGVLDAPSLTSLLQISALILGLFAAWLWAAMQIYDWAFPGRGPVGVGEFYADLVTTDAGLRLALVGIGTGFLFAIATLAISVVSLPMTLDRHVDAPTALKASLKAFRRNPGVLAVWGAIVTGLLVLGALPLLVGLAVVVPVLGHATWHLYRRLIG